MNTMPRDLVLVRHGQSEGNIAAGAWRTEHKDLFTSEFINRHSCDFRLTDKGREQAATTGKWIRENISETFDFYATSEYLRAVETAAYLGLPEPEWRLDIDLRERDHGLADAMHPNDRKREYGSEIKRFGKNVLVDPPPGGGESIATMRQRSWRIFTRLRRKVPEGKAILVCHGDFIRACRMDIERIDMRRFIEIYNFNDPFYMKNSDDSFYRIMNGHVIHYTRVNPTTGDVTPYYAWMRSFCPSAPDATSDKWRPIVRKRFTNGELLTMAAKYPRIIA